MALDRENVDRSYLFGRLLNVLEDAENEATHRVDITMVNTERYCQHPLTYAAKFREKIQPLLHNLPVELVDKYETEMEEIMCLMPENEELDKALGPTVWLGYYGERGHLREIKKEMKSNEANGN